MAAVTICSDFGAQKKSDTVSPSISHEVVGPDAMIFIFWMLSFKPTVQVRKQHLELDMEQQTGSK